MTCSLADDLRQFPDASDVVRVNSARWNEQHSAILEALCEGARVFLRSRKHLPLKQLFKEYERSEPCVEVDGQRAQLVYGLEPFFLHGSQLKMDVKGLVFVKPEAMETKC